MTYIGISTGLYHSMVLTKLGRPYGVGNNEYGQLGIGHFNHTHQATPVLLNQNITQLSCGFYHTLLLDDSGTPYAVGSNQFGQLSFSNETAYNEPLPMNGPFQKIIQIATGDIHSVLLDASGQVFSVGGNTFGQLSLLQLNFTNQMHPVVIQNETIIQISAFADNTGYLTLSNRLILTGKDEQCYKHQCYHPKHVDRTSLTMVSDGLNFSLYLDNAGNVFGKGANKYGQLGIQDQEHLINPIKLKINEKVIAMSTGCFHSLLLTEKSHVYGVGRNQVGQLGLNSIENTFNPTILPIVYNISSISCGCEHSLFLENSGKPFGSGLNQDGQLGIGNNMDVSTLKPMKLLSSINQIIQISAGFHYSLVLDASFTPYGVGRNNDGQLGLGTTKNHTIFQQITYFENIPISKVAAGDIHSLFMSDNGIIYGTGSNQYEQLNMNSLVPTPFNGQVPNLRDIKSGPTYSMYLTSDQIYVRGTLNNLVENRLMYQQCTHIGTGLYGHTVSCFDDQENGTSTFYCDFGQIKSHLGDHCLSCPLGTACPNEYEKQTCPTNTHALPKMTYCSPTHVCNNELSNSSRTCFSNGICSSENTCSCYDDFDSNQNCQCRVGFSLEQQQCIRDLKPILFTTSSSFHLFTDEQHVIRIHYVYPFRDGSAIFEWSLTASDGFTSRELPLSTFDFSSPTSLTPSISIPSFSMDPTMLTYRIVLRLLTTDKSFIHTTLQFVVIPKQRVAFGGSLSTTPLFANCPFYNFTFSDYQLEDRPSSLLQYTLEFSTVYSPHFYCPLRDPQLVQYVPNTFGKIHVKGSVINSEDPSAKLSLVTPIDSLPPNSCHAGLESIQSAFVNLQQNYSHPCKFQWFIMNLFNNTNDVEDEFIKASDEFQHFVDHSLLNSPCLSLEAFANMKRILQSDLSKHSMNLISSSLHRMTSAASLSSDNCLSFCSQQTLFDFYFQLLEFYLLSNSHHDISSTTYWMSTVSHLLQLHKTFKYRNETLCPFESPYLSFSSIRYQYSRDLKSTTMDHTLTLSLSLSNFSSPSAFLSFFEWSSDLLIQSSLIFIHPSLSNHLTLFMNPILSQDNLTCVLYHMDSRLLDFSEQICKYALSSCVCRFSETHDSMMIAFLTTQDPSPPSSFSISSNLYYLFLLFIVPICCGCLCCCFIAIVNFKKLLKIKRQTHHLPELIHQELSDVYENSEFYDFEFPSRTPKS
mmetsp:Transcript_13170/g.19877  ORF Transcript_13170/g.19877 Transcript_13170/m.19877 type:complete len:1200 (-) Transcript_13170:5-3604(-)